jgi:hypothetical protein
MPYIFKGISHTDAGVVNTRAGPSTGTIGKSDGWAHDASGRGFTVTTGAIAYRFRGRTFTADGSLRVTSAAFAQLTDYLDDGARFNSQGFAYTQTLRVPE